VQEEQIAYSRCGKAKYSTNSRPRKNKIKFKKNIRRTNVKLTIPARKKLCKVEEITEVDTFNCMLNFCHGTSENADNCVQI